jgi:hypothetical protein
VIAALLLAGPTQGPPAALKKIGDMFVGRWITETVLDADGPFGKKGDKVATYFVCRWIDQLGMECQTTTPQGGGRELIMWDATTHKVRTVGFDPGSVWDGVIESAGSSLAVTAVVSATDGHRFQEKAQVFLGTQGTTLTILGTLKGSGPTQNFRNVFRRISK